MSGLSTELLHRWETITIFPRFKSSPLLLQVFLLPTCPQTESVGEFILFILEITLFDQRAENTFSSWPCKRQSLTEVRERKCCCVWNTPHQLQLIISNWELSAFAPFILGCFHSEHRVVLWSDFLRHIISVNCSIPEQNILYVPF